ncbi:MAG: osmotically inducible protein OsmC [Pontimonas sp.]|jgi:osmotically inducible protein OsmC
MAVTSEARTTWHGSLIEGSGNSSLLSSGAGSFDVTWAARSEGQTGVTNPEELLGAAHSACYSMALSHALAGAGMPPTSVEVTAAVTFVPGEGVTGSHLLVMASVPGLDEAGFAAFAEEAKVSCPISQALAGIPITLEATLQ